MAIRRNASRQAPVEIRHCSRLLIGSDAQRSANREDVVRMLRRHPPDAYLDFWTWNRVRLLCIHRARALGVSNPLWDGVERDLRRRTQARATAHELAALEATRALAREGIDVLVLKGPALARRLYGEVGLRDPSTDVDLLVRATDLERSARVLERRWWTETAEPLHRTGLPDLHRCFRGSASVPAIELHWRMHWYDDGEHAEWLLARSTSEGGLPVPADEDLLHLMLLFWARDGFHRLRLGADVVAAGFSSDGGMVLPPLQQLQGPLEFAAAGAAAVLTGGPSAGPLRRRAVQRLALSDLEAAPHAVFTRTALIDLLIDPRPSGHAVRTMFLRHPAILRHRYPRLPAALIPVARVASATRTTWRAARELARRPRT